MDELFAMTATELARAIREKRLGVTELTRAYLDRIERYDGTEGLNAVALIDEGVLETAKRMDEANAPRKGAMYGLPVLIKDNIDVKGLPTTAGSRALTDNIAERDAPLVANLRRNGAIILGKTNMTEFANFTTENMPDGYSSLAGQVRNAYDGEKSPSGSSSGSAVAMSAGLCAAAVGSDTSFSIVGCVIENGVTGYKPAIDSLSSRGIVPISHTLDSAGPITRDLPDAVLVYNCMRDTPLPTFNTADLQSLCIGVNITNRDEVDKAQLNRYEAVFDGLRSDGARIDEVEHPFVPCPFDIMRYEFMHDLEEYLSHTHAKLRTLKEIVDFYEGDPAGMMKYGITLLRGALGGASGNLDDPAYIQAMAERERLCAALLSTMGEYDAYVMTGWTDIMHILGLPSLALRLGMGEDGMPRGMILYGTDEVRLLGAALRIERYCESVPMPALNANTER